MKFRHIFLILKIIFFTIIFVNLFNLTYSFISIKNGNLQYWKEIGWVDMGHANPCGTTEFLNQINKANQSTSKTKQIKYLQTQKKLGYKMQAGYMFQTKENEFNNLDAFFIFQTVSRQFELKQKQNFLIHSRLRGFGDLNGNTISFWCSLNDISKQEFFSNLTPLSKKQEYLLLLKNWITYKKDKNTIVSTNSPTLHNFITFLKTNSEKNVYITKEFYKIDFLKFKIKNATVNKP